MMSVLGVTTSVPSNVANDTGQLNLSSASGQIFVKSFVHSDTSLPQGLPARHYEVFSSDKSKFGNVKSVVVSSVLMQVAPVNTSTAANIALDSNWRYLADFSGYISPLETALTFNHELGFKGIEHPILKHVEFFRSSGRHSVGVKVDSISLDCKSADSLIEFMNRNDFSRAAIFRYPAQVGEGNQLRFALYLTNDQDPHRKVASIPFIVNLSTEASQSSTNLTDEWLGRICATIAQKHLSGF